VIEHVAFPAKLLVWDDFVQFFFEQWLVKYRAKGVRAKRYARKRLGEISLGILGHTCCTFIFLKNKGASSIGPTLPWLTLKKKSASFIDPTLLW